MACSTAAIFLGMFTLTGTNAYPFAQGQSHIVWVMPLLVYVSIGRLVRAKVLRSALYLIVHVVVAFLAILPILAFVGQKA